MKGALGDREKLPLLIFSCLRDKPIAEMAQILFPLFEKVILVPIRAARAAEMQLLMDAAAATGTPAVAAESVRSSLQIAIRELADRKDEDKTIAISGSVYLVGEARSLLLAERPAGAGEATA